MHQPFSRCKGDKYWKCTEWSQNDLEHLTVKRSLYTLSTHPRGSHFGPVRSVTICFQDTRWLKIGKIRNSPNDLRLTLNTYLLTVKCTLSKSKVPHNTKYIPWGPNSGPAVVEIQGCWKSEMHRITSEWPWLLNSKKYPIYIKYPQRPKFGSF